MAETFAERVKRMSDETGLDCQGAGEAGRSLTKQAFKNQVNINTIMAKYRKTGMIEHVNGEQPFYGDVSDIKSYQDACNIVAKAEELFYGMSSDIRKRFENDPAKLIAFLQDEKNLDEARQLGIVAPAPVAAVPPVVVPPVVKPPEGGKPA